MLLLQSSCMLTQDDLDQIAKQFAASLDAIVGSLKRDVATKADLETLKADVANIKREMATKSDLAAVEKRLTEKIDEGHEQIIETITRTADAIIERQEPRFRQIEEHLGLQNPTKKN